MSDQHATDGQHVIGANLFNVVANNPRRSPNLVAVRDAIDRYGGVSRNPRLEMHLPDWIELVKELAAIGVSWSSDVPGASGQISGCPVYVVSDMDRGIEGKPLAPNYFSLISEIVTAEYVDGRRPEKIEAGAERWDLIRSEMVTIGIWWAVNDPLVPPHHKAPIPDGCVGVIDGIPVFIRAEGVA